MSPVCGPASAARTCDLRTAPFRAASLMSRFCAVPDSSAGKISRPRTTSVSGDPAQPVAKGADDLRLDLHRKSPGLLPRLALGQDRLRPLRSAAHGPVPACPCALQRDQPHMTKNGQAITAQGPNGLQIVRALEALRPVIEQGKSPFKEMGFSRSQEDCRKERNCRWGKGETDGNHILSCITGVKGGVDTWRWQGQPSRIGRTPAGLTPPAPLDQKGEGSAGPSPLLVPAPPSSADL
jgi:hypothetical protein